MTTSSYAPRHLAVKRTMMDRIKSIGTRYIDWVVEHEDETLFEAIRRWRKK